MHINILIYTSVFIALFLWEHIANCNDIVVFRPTYQVALFGIGCYIFTFGKTIRHSILYCVID